MAISDVTAFAHLTDADVEALGRELDEIRRDVAESLGQDDATYIRRMIHLQRRIAVAGRVTLFASAFPPAWLAGTALLATAKILENMEIGHNVMHGQWDWMNDPEIHSGTWEWDTTCPAESWKHSHNFVHHTFTNVLGKDNDVGYGILRVSRDQPWHPINLGQPVYNALLALLFEWGVALHDLDLERNPQGSEGPEGTQAAAARCRPQDPAPGGQGLPDLPAAVGTGVHVHPDREHHRESGTQPMVLPDHFLWALPRRGREVHRAGAGERVEAAVVSAPAAGFGQLHGQPPAAHSVRKPRLPDRTPSVSRSA